VPPYCCEVAISISSPVPRRCCATHLVSIGHDATTAAVDWSLGAGSLILSAAYSNFSPFLSNLVVCTDVLELDPMSDWLWGDSCINSSSCHFLGCGICLVLSETLIDCGLGS
jgi:hypothetical protein